MKSYILKIFSGLSNRFGQQVIRFRLLLVIGMQLLLVMMANLLALFLRFDGEIPASYREPAFMALPVIASAYMLMLWVCDSHRGLWRYVGLHDLTRIAWASSLGTVLIYVLIHGVMGLTTYPRSVIILTGVLVAGSLAGVRLGVRWFREWLHIIGPTARRVLIIGAGHAGEMLIRQLQTDPTYNCKAVGILDDDPAKQKARIHGVRVVGTVSDIKHAVDLVEAQEIIVAIPSASTALRQRILASTEGLSACIKILPNVRRILADPALMEQVRPMSLEDLLQREPIQMDRQELHPLIEGKTVLVTGAGGSIGSELCRQIAGYKPESLVLFERYENALHALLLELRSAFPHVGVLPVIGDVTLPERVEEVFKQTGPDIVFHAAAHKHVPLMELNPKEAIRNNVLGTRVVAEAALAARVDRFVLISTDKAVNPSSVMGATKRVAEHVIRGLSQQGLTKFTVVRFGNVLGSNGSVVPLFSEQIRKGGPVTVTHPEIKRFFMTIPEAVQLVLQASVMGQGGEVFVLDMGEQIKIADLARNMIVLSGLVPGKDVGIVYTGLRAGEKLYEELFEESEQVQPTAHPKINRAVGASLQADDLECWINELPTKISGNDEEDLLQDLKRFVPTFQPVMPQRVS